jgi:hypothetical protein
MPRGAALNAFLMPAMVAGLAVVNSICAIKAWLVILLKQMCVIKLSQA